MVPDKGKYKAQPVPVEEYTTAKLKQLFSRINFSTRSDFIGICPG
jgi:hypothetical protein